jgi:hypothetical protein
MTYAHTIFYPNPSSGSRVESYRHNQTYTHSFHAYHIKNAQNVILFLSLTLVAIKMFDE